MFPIPPEWIALAIIATIGLILPIFGLWPPILRGDSVSNNFLFVSITDRRNQPEAALKAQEVCEYWLRLLVAVPLSAGVMVLLAVPWFFIPVLVAALGMWTIITPLMRQIEYIGHAVEVLEANRDGEPLETYLLAEAKRTQRAYSGAFEHLTVNQMAAKFRSRFGVARLLIALLHRRWRE